MAFDAGKFLKTPDLESCDNLMKEELVLLAKHLKLDFKKCLFGLDPCFPPPRCPRPPRGPPGTCPPQCVYEYAIVNGKRCRVACKLWPPGPKGEPGEPCPPSLCGDGIAEPLPPPTTITTTTTTPPPSKGPCPPRPPCPRLGRMGKPGAPGPCPPKCVFEYAIVNGKRCRVACTRGPDGPDRQPGEFCPPTLVCT
ncbi:Hypothetical predicted protein [Mytilus galloprovincialis]|uniref:Uncharacterized protein n=1 Tax=Mytilus galloprovincialis TaxID=29158 RepID=A0A8B6BP94_MYTGA|nr:Hypothetical predicted protein [Mytilus galloprovincialis]